MEGRQGVHALSSLSANRSFKTMYFGHQIAVLAALSIPVLATGFTSSPKRFMGKFTKRPASATLSSPTVEDQDDWLADVPMGPPDAILGLAQEFRACTAADKVNLVVGAYRDSDGNPYVLPSVRAAELAMLDQGVNKEYAPIAGDAEFVERALAFAFGVDNEALTSGRIAGVQALSGTGSLILLVTYLG